MDIQHQYTETPLPAAGEQRIIEYAELTERVQMGTAIRLGIMQPLAKASFAELLLYKEPAEVQAIVEAVGARFDEALVDFVIGSIINRPPHTVVIRAEAAEGIDGTLPWAEPLMSRVSTLQENGYLRNISVQIERFTDTYAPVTQLSPVSSDNLEDAA